MTGARFTPGPWAVSGPWAGFGSIKTADGALIFGIARGDEDEAQPVEACEANAHLIAAAPELYGQAEFLCARLRDLEGCDTADLERQLLGHVLPALARMESTLAKARGEV